jgi:hypothetical protein
MAYCTRFAISALLMISIIGFVVPARAQQGKPVVKTSLGSYSANSTISADEAKKLIVLPLVVTDNNNKSYPIESYQFLYKKKSVMEDKNTGKKAYAFTPSSDLFKSSPLPASWISKISDLQKDEELSFFDIQVKDEKGNKFFAPDLKLKIQ